MDIYGPIIYNMLIAVLWSALGFGLGVACAHGFTGLLRWIKRGGR